MKATVAVIILLSFTQEQAEAVGIPGPSGRAQGTSRARGPRSATHGVSASGRTAWQEPAVENLLGWMWEYQPTTG